MQTLIWSEEEVQRFISMLPEVDELSGYLLMLIVRSRYAKQRYGIKCKDIVLQFEFVRGGKQRTPWREMMLLKIRRLALLGAHSNMLFTVEGSYKYVYPEPDTVGLMCVMNPANLRKAFYEFLQEKLRLLVYTNDWYNITRVISRWYGNIHATCNKIFHCTDIDSKDPKIISEVLSELDKLNQPYMIIETCRGYHMIINIQELAQDKNIVRYYYQIFLQQILPRLQEKYSYIENGEKKTLIEHHKHIQEPIPGTIYAGFNVRMVDKSKL